MEHTSPTTQHTQRSHQTSFSSRSRIPTLTHHHHQGEGTGVGPVRNHGEKSQVISDKGTSSGSNRSNRSNRSKEKNQMDQTRSNSQQAPYELSRISGAKSPPPHQPIHGLSGQ